MKKQNKRNQEGQGQKKTPLYLLFKMDPKEKGLGDHMPTGSEFESTCSTAQGAPWSLQN